MGASPTITPTDSTGAAIRRIGLMGGSFDPVHTAHLALARTALSHLSLDQVRWIPVGQPWQKARQLAAPAHRLAMVALATADEPRFVVDDIEIRREGPSYTLDTVHERTTAQEILNDFPEGLDALITGVGTGGHITGCARVLKKAWPQLKVFAVEPAASPVISGGSPAPHPIQGIGAGFVPGNLDTTLLDGTIQVDAEASREMARRAAREEGLLVGISSGATLQAIAQKLPELGPKARVLGFCYDTGERYLSVDGFLPA